MSVSSLHKITRRKKKSSKTSCAYLLRNICYTVRPPYHQEIGSNPHLRKIVLSNYLEGKGNSMGPVRTPASLQSLQT